MPARPTPSNPSPRPTSPSPIFPTLSDIRETCRFVTAHAKHAQLNSENLRNFAKTITTPPAHWLTTNPHDLLTLPLPLLSTILLYFEVIDYSFWPDPITSQTSSPTQASEPTQISDSTSPQASNPQTPQKWTIKTPSGPLDGSVALLYLLIRHAKSHSLDFDKFSDADFYTFFHPSGALGEISLLSERIKTLRETSRLLRTKLNNNFYAAIQSLSSDEQLFHFLITTFPSFRDQRTYSPQDLQTAPDSSAATPDEGKPASRTIHFYKLAQLLTSDLLFVRRHLENIPVDTKNLPGCADYKIPQTLRALNLITYDAELSKLVDARRLIPENSPYEIEIRAATVSAIAFLHNELPAFSPIQINDYLFLASRSLKKKQPYHLTRSVNY